MTNRHLIAALYKFTPLEDLPGLRDMLFARGEAAGICGSLLLAPGGINGTIAGPEAALRWFLAELTADERFAGISLKESWSDEPPFMRFKVRLKREIVSMGAPDVVSPETVGTYVKPEDWNALIADPEVAVIDTRNDYEVAIGQFARAIDPETTRFRDFPDWAQQWTADLGDNTNAEGRPPRPRAVAMYCTGGIRCEKATALMRSLGNPEVYHLDGGILSYLEKVPPEESLWQGQCFVFDERVSVGHGLEPGGLDFCRGCRRPITEADRTHSEFEDGVCCPACTSETTPQQREARRERHRQVALAEQRGARHLGANTPQATRPEKPGAA